MWMMGTCGLCGWSTLLTPVAANRPASVFICCFNPGLTAPCTAEKLSPPFSMTRPFWRIRVSPPPPSGRSHVSRTLSRRPSKASKAATCSSWTCRWAFCTRVRKASLMAVDFNPFQFFEPQQAGRPIHQTGTRAVPCRPIKPVHRPKIVPCGEPSGGPPAANR